MTVNEVLAIVDKQCPNQIEKVEKVRQLSILEGRIVNEVLSNFPEVKVDAFRGYNVDTDGSKELIADSPYDQMYVHYLMAQIYLSMLEQRHYNNQIYIFNSIYQDYKVNCYRTMRPSSTSYRTR